MNEELRREEELKEEEVNVYAGCGYIRYVCLTDCLPNGSAFMNITVRQSRQSGVARATCPD